MSISTITLGSGGSARTVNLVTMPNSPGLKAVEFTPFDAVSTLTSPWTGQMQRQYWPGGDRMSAKCTLPPLVSSQAAQWKAWRLQMRGMLNAVMLGDPDAQTPQGQAQGLPLVDGSVGGNNAAGATQLYTKGWNAGVSRQLLPGDALQIGYRLHYVLGVVNSDGSGKAAVEVWPSIREQPADGDPVTLNSPKGLFSLATNSSGWGLRLPLITDMSFDLMEYR